ncbi:MAG TPA: 4a-hydroxytetrahydrobiopterin dehydratase [Herpetosiphonaceae bacterium]
MAGLDEAAVARRLADLPGWKIARGELSRSYKLDSFAFAIEFVRRIGELAELANHHPTMEIRFDTVKVRLSTAEAGGLTERDFELAGRIDGLLEAEAGG